MATLTATNIPARAEAVALANGATVTRVWQYIQSATASSGDVVYNPFWRIPKDAVIFKVAVSGRTVDGTAILTPGVRVYNSASAATDTLFGSLTLSVAGRIGDVIHSSAGDSAHLPMVVSIPDDSSQPHYAHFVLKWQANASATTSTSLDVIVQYVMDR